MILSEVSIEALESYLFERGYLSESEKLVKTEKPGEGNMNFTLRVFTNHGRTFIVKQSRGFVEKYPSIAAPENRAIIEGEFYKYIGNNQEIAVLMPKLLGIDTENNLIVTEDLGQSNDLSYLYQQGKEISKEELEALVSYLNLLHSSFRAENQIEHFKNKEMRALNHEHIFIYPFMEENGFDLDTIQNGLQKVAMEFKLDTELKNIIKTLGEMYLSDGQTLLHGDYYFGSFLKTTKGIKVIDPEFCFYGFPEFDLAVLIAHLLMADQTQDKIDLVIQKYIKAVDFNETRLKQFVGVEIMRRIIGLAQLPLSLSLEKKIELLNKAKQMILNT